MPQVFHPAFNTISRVSIFGGLFLLAGGFYVVYAFYRSPYSTEQHVIQTQPVPFSHRHHVGDIGMDCRYCHTSVEESSSANIPPTATCMNCHSQLWAESPMLAPVRDSFKTDTPLRWSRVHDVPDYAYFNHSIHIRKGVGCVSCHGQVDDMPLMWRENTLHMDWCLDCHRNPQEHIRPREFVFSMKSRADLAKTGEFRKFVEENFHDIAEELGWAQAGHGPAVAEKAESDAEGTHHAVLKEISTGQLEEIAGQLVIDYHINKEQPKTHCSACHR